MHAYFVTSALAYIYINSRRVGMQIKKREIVGEKKKGKLGARRKELADEYRL